MMERNSHQAFMNGNARRKGDQTRANKTYEFHCALCGKNFSKKFHFNYHTRKEHSLQLSVTKKIVNYECILCGLEIEKQNYVAHLQHPHGIRVETQMFEFNSIEEFYSWKALIEKESKEKFVVQNGVKRRSNYKSYSFICHRSGFKKSSKIPRRFSKKSKKLNGICPASIKMTCSEETGKCEVKFIKTHIGHGDYIYNSNEDEASSLFGNDFNIEEISSEQDFLKEIVDGRINSPMKTFSINGKRDLLKLKVISIIDSLNSEEEIQACDKIISSLKPTVDAIRLHNAQIRHNNSYVIPSI